MSNSKNPHNGGLNRMKKRGKRGTGRIFDRIFDWLRI
jgi:hypothetical protein